MVTDLEIFPMTPFWVSLTSTIVFENIEFQKLVTTRMICRVICPVGYSTKACLCDRDGT